MRFRGALVGCGFFSRYHLHGWREIEDTDVIAVCDVEGSRAEKYANEFDVPRFYTDVHEMLKAEEPDFVDIVTPPATHASLARAVASAGAAVICQKPLSLSLGEARSLVRDLSGVPTMLHENFRWQLAMRELKNLLPEIGDPFFGRLTYRSGFDVYANQPYLRDMERYIIFDFGSHMFDLLRFFLGEARTVVCRTQRVNPDIRGEDVATALVEMESGAVAAIDMSYASVPERELFPQVLVGIEGSHGTAALGPDYEVTLAKRSGARRWRVPPVRRSWSEPPLDGVQDSVVRIQEHFVSCLRLGSKPETTFEDNLHTLELVFAAYRSADSGQVERLHGERRG